MQKNLWYAVIVGVLVLGAVGIAAIDRTVVIVPELVVTPQPPVTTSTTTTQPVLPERKTGTIVGHVDIGPICPVEQMPPSKECEPGPQHYAAYRIVVSAVNSDKALRLPPIDSSGNYRVEVPNGTYRVEVKPDREGAPGGVSGVPRTVVVAAGATVRVDISIDTGIR